MEENKFEHHSRGKRLEAVATQSRSAAAEVVAPVDRSSRIVVGWQSIVVVVEPGSSGHRRKVGRGEEDRGVVPSMLFQRMGGGRECDGGGR